MDTEALRTVEANGITLACRAWGPAEAPPLVLLHCRGADGGDWTHLAERLAAPRAPPGVRPRPARPPAQRLAGGLPGRDDERRRACPAVRPRPRQRRRRGPFTGRHRRLP